MSELVRYRAMESLCRQKAVFRPQESWRLLAEAEMWHHKAQEELAQMTLRLRGRSSLDAPIDPATAKQVVQDLLLAS
jgi:hypothetical protein